MKTTVNTTPGITI